MRSSLDRCAARDRRQAGRVRGGVADAGELLRATGLPAGDGRRPDRRGGHFRRGLRRLHRAHSRRSSPTSCCARRWRMARRSRRSTSRSSAPSASRACPARRSSRVCASCGITQFQRRVAAARATEPDRLLQTGWPSGVVRSRSAVDAWTFIWLMVILKIPIVALFLLVRWAVARRRSPSRGATVASARALPAPSPPSSLASAARAAAGPPRRCAPPHWRRARVRTVSPAGASRSAEPALAESRWRLRRWRPTGSRIIGASHERPTGGSR